ncbi:lytic transglycosylase domain-containing protein [Sphingoaurantiacus capsulatus]|uniref:Lytic transglycosylase domain-containing protein n=1 Tax=Sphingoaurantiacus capsulatus TaxID=1771310 RepID=A0ABV7XAZ1_9SPHN
MRAVAKTLTAGAVAALCAGSASAGMLEMSTLALPDNAGKPLGTWDGAGQLTQAAERRAMLAEVAASGPVIDAPAISPAQRSAASFAAESIKLHELEASDDDLRGVPGPMLASVKAAAKKYNLSPLLIDAVARQESGYRANARSRAGALGIMQLMPGTARMMGVRNALDPHANIDGGARYLRFLVDRFGGDLSMALAAYNAGPARVERAGGVPRIAETRNYVAKIVGRLTAIVAGRAPLLGASQ